MSSSIIAADTDVHFTFPGQSIKPFIEPNGMFNDRVATDQAAAAAADQTHRQLTYLTAAETAAAAAAAAAAACGRASCHRSVANSAVDMFTAPMRQP